MSKEYYFLHRDELLEKAKVYQKTNKEKIQKYRKQYHKDNAQKLNEYCRKYRKTNKEILKEKKLIYNKNNKDKTNSRYREHYKNDLSFRLKELLRGRLRQAIKKGFKKGSAVKDLGCSIDYFKKYLESQFNNGMTWNNCGKFWHIDHQIPLSYFDLTNEEDLKQAVHFTNLQPLMAMDNFIKHNNYYNGN